MSHPFRAGRKDGDSLINPGIGTPGETRIGFEPPARQMSDAFNVPYCNDDLLLNQLS
ncbi:hypothetical protein ACFL6I_03335 [candidate division KSB1 bacterium]